MSFMNRRRDVRSEDVANIPPELSGLHCFTETGGVITTSPPSNVRHPRVPRGAHPGRRVGALGAVAQHRGQPRHGDQVAGGGANNAVVCLRFDAAGLGGFAQTCVVEKIDAAAVAAPQLAV